MTAARNSLYVGAALFLLGAVAALLLAALRDHTAVRIAANERAYAMRQLSEIVPASRYDNDLLADAIVVRDPALLGGDEPREVYRAFAGERPVAAVIATVAPNGYSGTIDLLVGVNADGRLAGVRITRHRETPGLGDQIELERSNFLIAFNGRALGDPAVARWAVRDDGGAFDQFTGATVSPRAVVWAVRDALLYFRANRDEIFASPRAGEST